MSSFTYVIADVHGRFDLLTSAVSLIRRRVREEEVCTVVVLGDFVDRGPQSRQCIEYLMNRSFWENIKLVVLKGNHEAMMIETLKTPIGPSWWLGQGGDFTMKSYGHGNYMFEPSFVPASHIDWLEALPLYYADEHRVYVHAAVVDGVPLDQQVEDTFLWARYPAGYAYGYGEKHVVHGHTPFKSGPIMMSGRTNLDTGAVWTGRLVVGVFADELAGGPIDTIEVVATDVAPAFA